MGFFSHDDKISLKTAFTYNHYAVFVFVTLFLQFLAYVPSVENLNYFNAIYYVLSIKDFGFKSRLVIGSIVDIFTNYISNDTVYILITVFTLIFVLFISLIIGKIAETISNNTDSDPEVLLVLFCISPASIFYLFGINNFGRLDLFLILITVISLLCIKNDRTKWIVPVLCFMAMLFNQNFAIMYMPVVGIVLLYEFFDSKFSKVRLSILIISCLTIFISFVYFKVLTPVPNFNSMAEIETFLAGRTDVKGGELVVLYDYYISYFSFYKNEIRFDWIIDAFSPYGICKLCATLPIIISFSLFWYNSVKIEINMFKKAIFVICLLAPFGGLPMFLAIDWDRWIPTVFISQFMLVFYFIAVNDKTAVSSLIKLKSIFIRHYFLFVILIIYSSSFILSDFYPMLVDVIDDKVDLYKEVGQHFFE